MIPANIIDLYGGSPFGECNNLVTILVDENNPVYHSANNCIIQTDEKLLIAACSTSVIPSDGSVTRIGDRAFFLFDSLESMAIPNGVQEIGYDAFAHCSNLESIVIPATVERIGDGAFRDCSSLTSIIFQGTKAQWDAVVKEDEWDIGTGNYSVTFTN